MRGIQGMNHDSLGCSWIPVNPFGFLPLIPWIPFYSSDWGETASHRNQRMRGIQGMNAMNSWIPFDSLDSCGEFRAIEETREQVAALIAKCGNRPPRPNSPPGIPRGCLPGCPGRNSRYRDTASQAAHVEMSGLHRLNHEGTCSQARIDNAAPSYTS